MPSIHKGPSSRGFSLFFNRPLKCKDPRLGLVMLFVFALICSLVGTNAYGQLDNYDDSYYGYDYEDYDSYEGVGKLSLIDLSISPIMRQRKF